MPQKLYKVKSKEIKGGTENPKNRFQYVLPVMYHGGNYFNVVKTTVNGNTYYYDTIYGLNYDKEWLIFEDDKSHLFHFED